MTAIDIAFATATRLKLRFKTPVGAISVEDLWDLPLTAGNGKANLDDIAVALDNQLSTVARKSFVNQTKVDNDQTEIKLAFDIVNHVIQVKLDERDKAKRAADRRAQRQTLLNLLAEKENARLQEASADELRNLLASLDAEEDAVV